MIIKNKKHKLNFKLLRHKKIISVELEIKYFILDATGD